MRCKLSRREVMSMIAVVGKALSIVFSDCTINTATLCLRKHILFYLEEPIIYLSYSNGTSKEASYYFQSSVLGGTGLSVPLMMSERDLLHLISKIRIIDNPKKNI
jgi:hypothetical protein